MREDAATGVVLNDSDDLREELVPGVMLQLRLFARLGFGQAENNLPGNLEEDRLQVVLRIEFHAVVLHRLE